MARSFAASDKLIQAIKLELGDIQILTSEKIKLSLPLIAEDGAFVPLSLESSLDEVDAFYLFAENNPTPLIARFLLNRSLEAYVSLSIKLNSSGEVLALVRSEGLYYGKVQEVKVVIGGCGSNEFP